MSSRGGRGGGGGGSELNRFHKTQGPTPQPDPAVRKTEDDFVKKVSSTLSLSRLSLNAQFPIRPAHGSQGTPAIVYANYLPLNPAEKLSFYQYHVTISLLSTAPKVSKAKTKRLLELLLEHDNFNDVTSDFSSQLVSRSKIKDVPGNFDIAYKAEGEDAPPERPSIYRLSIQETGTVSPAELLNDLKRTDPDAPQYRQRTESIQCVNIVLGHSPQIRQDISTIGQNKYYSVNPSMGNKRELSPGVQALRGFFKSVRPATSRLLLNVNVSHTACYEPTDLGTLMYGFGLRDKIVLGRLLRLLRVNRNHFTQRKNEKGSIIPRLATIWDLATTNDGHNNAHRPKVKIYGAGPKDVEFWLEEPQATGTGQSSLVKGSGGNPSAGRYISVWNYFQKNYATKMNPNLPVVNTGNRENPRYLPAEVCRVEPGQPYGKKLDVQQTRNMIQFACRKPNENADSIVGNQRGDGREVLSLDSNSAVKGTKNTLARNGLTVGTSLITVNARILQAPDIHYGPGSKNRKISPRFGAWNLDASVFNTPAKISSWAYVWVKESSQARGGFTDIESVRDTVKAFTRCVNQAGVVLGPVPHRDITLDDVPNRGQINVEKIDTLLKGASGAPEGSKPKFILFILPRNDSSLYAKIKRLGDVTYGIQTICVVEEKFSKKDRRDQYFANVSLKVNLKAGGINQMLDPKSLGIISEGHTMVVGIDVTHPSPGSKSTAPSVAGMVASVDKFLGQWPADLRIQEKRKEMVTDVGEMLKTRLERWRLSNNVLPRNILIYRDGVSEGQYAIVLNEELPLLRKACTEIYPANSLPKISIIIVGKRHHTRFYPTSNDNADKSANCRNGTIVDRGVTEVRDWHFYLQAHACLQGTARPAHYFVILDEIFRARRQPASKVPNTKSPPNLKMPMPYKGSNSTSNVNQNAADDLEGLTHNLCHLFGRATKAVSICPPAYYADLLCERARCYLAHHFDPTPGNGDEKAPGAEEIRVHDNLKDTMFYI